jgi:hypothetical protein
MNYHASLSLENSIAIGLGYEFSPNMMGIQEGHNKNIHEDH